VDPIGRERHRDPAHPLRREAHEELEVEEVPAVLVERPVALPTLAAPQSRGLDDVVVRTPYHLRDVELARAQVAGLPRPLVGVERVAVDEQELRVALERLDHASDGTRQQRVVRVQIAQVLAGRPREPAVQRRDLPRVLLPRPPREPVRVALDDLGRRIRGAVVDHEVLDRLVVLVEHRANRLLEERRLVVRRGDDRDESPRHAAASTCS
jgi:hypothetical protein